MMKRTNALSLCFAGLALSFASGGAFADSGDDASQAALRQRVAELEQRLAQLEGRDDASWLTQQRAAEIRSLVYDVLADADTRASLLQGGATAGWDGDAGGGFFIGSADGNYMLRIKGLIQTRYVFNSQDDADGAVDSSRGGFEFRNTRLEFTGHVVDPTWIYRIQGDFSRSGGAFTLLDAYIGHAFDDSGWTALAGQFKVPMLRETLLYVGRDQLVDRTLVEAEFGAGRTQGVAIDYRQDQFHFVAGFTDGHPTTGGFNSPALAYDTEYAFTARGELLFDGAWSQFNDMPSWPDEEFAFMLGAAAHYQMGEFGTAADELEVFQWTVDASLEFGGANLFGYVVGRHLDATGLEADQYGAVIQGGIFVNDDWELFGRYEWGDLDFSDEELGIITVGATRYFARHALKWTTDVGYGIETVSPMWGGGFVGGGSSRAGWRADPDDEDGQIVLRSQFQLLF